MAWQTERMENLTMLDSPKPTAQIDLEEYIAWLEEQADRHDHDRAQEGNQ
jgi:hypothetical protein